MDAGDNKRSEQRRVPVFALVMTTFATVFLAVGVAGLYVPELMPFALPPNASWSMVAVGIVLDGFAVVQIVAARQQKR